MSLLLLFGSIALLLCLILLFKLNAFIALLLTSMVTGLACGIAPSSLPEVLQKGMGSTLGGLAPVLGLGVILGSLLSETGATQVISDRMIDFFGEKRAKLAFVLTGFVLGIALFYNAGFVILAPLVFAVAANRNLPLLPLAIAMAAPLSVTHGFLPPHPSAIAVANAFKADMGKTLLYGLIIGVPISLLAGLFFAKFLKNIPTNPPQGLFVKQDLDKKDLPNFGKSLFVALLPVLLMALSTLTELFFPAGFSGRTWLKFLGDPGISLLIAVLMGLFLFTSKSGPVSITGLLQKSEKAVGAAAMLFLVIGAGGAFKQVLVDSKLGDDLARQFSLLPISPLILGWGIATILRIAVGSATVAGITAAGIVAPMLQTNSVSPELMTLAIGAGSLMCSHVNDTGFWMFKEWFGLSVKDTFRSWTVMETIIGLSGLIGVLLLNWLT